MELLLTESDNVIKKVETEFDQKLKKQHPDCTDVKKLKEKVETKRRDGIA